MLEFLQRLFVVGIKVIVCKSLNYWILELLQRVLVIDIKTIIFLAFLWVVMPSLSLNHQMFEPLQKPWVIMPSFSFGSRQIALYQYQLLLQRSFLLVAIRESIIIKAINFNHARQVNHLFGYMKWILFITSSSNN